MQWLREALSLEFEKEVCGKDLWAPFQNMMTYQTKLLQALEVCLGTRALDNNNIDANVEYTTQKDHYYCFGSIMLSFLKEALPVFFNIFNLKQFYCI